MIAEQAIAEHKPARTPMWCDDFDMDLLKLLPEVERLLAPCQGIRLYTTCNPTHVRINLPSVWHQRGGLTCYVGFLRPDDPLPEKGPQPAYCMTFSPVVEATAEEMFRDLWCHNLVWVQVSSPKMRELWRDSAQIWNAHALTGSFNILLYALRGWEPVPENRLYFHRCRVLKSISRAASRLRRLYDRFLILDLAATFVENRVTDFQSLRTISVARRPHNRFGLFVPARATRSRTD